MASFFETQRTTQILKTDFYFFQQVEMFIMDRKSAGLSSGTIRFYNQKLKPFFEFCDGQMVKSVLDIDAPLLRRFMLLLEEQGHNYGGQHAFYRAIRAFLLWFEMEAEPENWKNPIHKVKAPKVPQEIFPPVKTQVVYAMIETCSKDTAFDLRDKAILLMLYDTGLRASELLDLNREDMDQAGNIFIHQGKGKKDRLGFVGKKTRSAIRKYLRKRTDDHPALFLSRYQDRLGYDGLRGILSRRAKIANVPQPSVHDFRRAFALEMLRAGTDVHTLAKLMGHSNISVLSRYLKLDDTDIRNAHDKSRPVDNNL